MPRWTMSRFARLAVLLLPTLLVLASVGVTASIAVTVQESSIREATGERVRDVATSLARLDQVRTVLERTGDDVAEATRELQPLADVVEQAAGVDYLVVTDDRGIRITHPTPELRGGHVSTSIDDVLDGREFLGTERGTLGRTLRAKVPVRDDAGRVIGSLSVGILETRIAADFEAAVRQLLPWALGALLVGTLASTALATLLERRLRRLEALSREAEGIRRTAAALREQTHEFHTRLHVIHGLVSHGDTAEALAYIAGAAPVDESEGAADSRYPLLRATLDALRAELGGLGAQLETAIDVDADVDEDVTLVLANLCRNAGEAGASRVRCTLTGRGGVLRGEVADDGPGIAGPAADRVFARGFSSKLDASGLGRGIGLDLVRRIIADRNGTVELGRSDLGGARFRFEIGGRA
ncbi:sensor histidine kinase [Leucobacter chromiiresistens]|uniref:histidine kinase n=1 Tax=Leucobacter chromiiresistens TaxID=1079994 RepID=A0A1H0YDH3_9MICO|nr:ATP-binding protein [Leucobacter chromiiresistens]SDQ13208.1 Histidine kinase-, DNA gyrase B-, and HSP90-like ATPase [Leucobacter chromiiresistens]